MGKRSRNNEKVKSCTAQSQGEVPKSTPGIGRRIRVFWMHIDFDTHTHCTKSVLFFLNYNYYFDSYYVDHKVDTEKGGRKNRNSLVFLSAGCC